MIPLLHSGKLWSQGHSFLSDSHLRLLSLQSSVKLQNFISSSFYSCHLEVVFQTVETCLEKLIYRGEKADSSSPAQNEGEKKNQALKEYINTAFLSPPQNTFLASELISMLKKKFSWERLYQRRKIVACSMVFVSTLSFFELLCLHVLFCISLQV